ncbi:pyruvate, phosphate dikinase [Fenollaria massiliensis]|uniref:Pyruvate, phosphate dikinase n=2 Tax=Fenollaria massiliensis TaxID=938288 RepID=A0A9E7IWE4_9FIRM|nr:pyruvate, phosphate dikinase [Fenollaria massiliensis]UQK59724.1 pyruvate, phosphate dikinase [Fenollaria massiliensis]
MEKYVYSFKEGNKDMRDLLGGKGANLAEMTNLGLPVPNGFTITTQACNRFYEENEELWQDLKEEIRKGIENVEKITNKGFSDKENPLLFSVRSGAKISMPGMMDTILNLGLNDVTVEGLSKKTNNERFAYDSYRRFIQMFSDVAMGIPKAEFDKILNKQKEKRNIESDIDLNTDDLKEIVKEYKAIYKKYIGEEFPQDPKVQLFNAVRAVFMSWNTPRAKTYRKLNEISDTLGTAVNVQEMVFGNMGMNSGTGVAFTRNPATGENVLFGEFLIDAQGEDVVAGVRTPEPIARLENELPSVYKEFKETVEKLEKHYKDMQDIEFTVENGKLFMLQCRNGKRTTKAAINIAVDQVNEGLITKEEAILRIEPKSIDQILHPTFEEKDVKSKEEITKGLPASPGAASGVVVFSPDKVIEYHKNNLKTILVREETSPEDIDGMVYAEGILTARGGMTSHAAVVARGMGKCCVAGCSELRVDEEDKVIRYHGGEIKEGDMISIDGSTGYVYLGEIKKVTPELSGNFAKFMEWADEFRTLEVKANADNPRDAKQALDFGAQGVGLCRTEHMFFDDKRIFQVRKMILSKTLEEREKALEKLLPYQRGDFEGIFKVMEEKGVVIRLLDPPLHEFLPKTKEDIESLAKDMGITTQVIEDRIEDMKEFNPMLGHRGCRLCVTWPEIYKMQVRAIMEAAINVSEEIKKDIKPMIMVPLIGELKELEFVKGHLVEEINKVFDEKNKKLAYEIGTMVEVPRAALLADEIAKEAEFFSFGTNDMTQMTWGYSRDDYGKFVNAYIDNGIYERSPFDSLDTEGVGKLLDMATKLGRQTRPDIHVGICGEHGGDPRSIEFCDAIGLDYVSCSPYRVPIARLAAAQAAIKRKSK